MERLFKGSIFCYKVFDLAFEIDLPMLQEKLRLAGLTKFPDFRRLSKNLVMQTRPLTIAVDTWKQVIFNRTFEIQAFAKIFSFGAVSLCLQVTFDGEISAQQAVDTSIFLDEDESIHQVCTGLVFRVLGLVKSKEEIEKCLWSQYEDYILFIGTPAVFDAKHIEDILESEIILHLVLLEEPKNLSEQMKIGFHSNVFQYKRNDIAALDWNCAYICSEEDSSEIADVIEFVLCQLTELRYFDDLLDRKLSELYNATKNKNANIFSSHYSKVAKEASALYLEISQTVEKVENSIKVVGDFYYAKIYRAAVEKFRVKDWQSNVDTKLNNLVEVTKVLKSDVDTRRALILELAIVFLFLVELLQNFKYLIP